MSTLRLEPLEAREVPAVFFLSSTALTVTDAAGNDAENLPNEIAAQAAAGSTKAILMSTGDTLVFDANDNHIRDPQERVLMGVTAGKAMVFLSDGLGPTSGAFDENEISGLAVSNGFQGAIHTDVNGAVTTTLDAAGNFQTTALQNASIAGLTVDGRVGGGLIAGKNISNVRIGSGLFTAGAEVSAQGVLTGNAGFILPVKYSFAGPQFRLVFAQVAGANGGNIFNVRLDNGALVVRTGTGGSITSGVGNGGTGGSIAGLNIVDSPATTLIATGPGGDSVHGDGGAGGNIRNSSINFHGSDSRSASVDAGDGGDSDSGSGGKGGAIVGTTIHMLDEGHSLSVTAGKGGQATGAGAVAGSGGSISNSTIIADGIHGSTSRTGSLGGDMIVVGGEGGSGAETAGGAGGSFVNTTVQVLDSQGTMVDLHVNGGQGGAGTKGGNGGAINGSTVLVNEGIGFDTGVGQIGSADITGGNGGDGVTAGGNGGAFNGNSIQLLGHIDLKDGNKLNITAGNGGNISGIGTAGHGGNFQAVPVNGVLRQNSIILSNVADDVEIHAGKGGSQATAASPGSGGGGGIMNGLSVELNVHAPSVSITAGNGGDAGTASGASGNGGIGGALSAVTVSSHADITDKLFILGGFGGEAGADRGIGGAGGGVTNVTARVNTVDNNVLIEAGSAAASHDANAAAGGNLSAVTFENSGLVNGSLVLAQGLGGVVTDTGNAGSGGSISHVTINNIGGFGNIAVGQNVLRANAGSGNGGNGGATSFITFNSFAHYSEIDIFGTVGTPAGNAATNANGSNTGSIDNVMINDFSDGGDVFIATSSGQKGRGAGKGGNSGSISNVSLNGPNTNFVIQTGNGGDSPLGQGGNAGSVSNVHGVVSSLRLGAADGGSAIGATGKGGAGGSVNGVNITGVGRFVRWIFAGNGGNGGLLGGNGGSIANVNVAGDIGDFSSPFSPIVTVFNDDGMGGLIAGQAGTGGTALNGSISQVTATRIAAIYAGRPRPDSITAANAVRSLTMINAQVIGANANNNGIFDFTDAGNPGFNLGDGDTAIDGFVLVNHASDLAGLPVSPLQGLSLVA